MHYSNVSLLYKLSNGVPWFSQVTVSESRILKKQMFPLSWSIKDTGASRPVLISSGCFDKLQQTEWLKQQMFISHSSGGREVQRWGVRWSVSWFEVSCSQLSSSCILTWWKDRALLPSSSSKSTNPVIRAPPLRPSNPNYLIKASPLNAITLETGPFTYEYEGNTNI